MFDVGDKPNLELKINNEDWRVIIVREQKPYWSADSLHKIVYISERLDVDLAKRACWQQYQR